MNWKLIGGIGLIIAALCIVLVYNYTKEPPEKAPSTGPPSAIKPVQPKTGSLALEFYSSSAKRTWINEVTAAFNAQDHRVDGKQIVVEVTHVTSGGSFRNIKEGKIKPDIWSPGDDSWIKLANVHWKNIHLKTLMPTTKPLVNVPLIIAMWEPMAQALGYPDKPVGWTDIARIAADPKGWAAFGHPEWGKFKWGHAHAEANSGFLTVISEIYASCGKTENLTVDDLKSPKVKKFLKTAESAIEHYGMSNSWIDNFMRTKGPGYLSAAVQYENTIIESNRKHGSTPFKLVAVYPKEGAFWTRHPVGIPDAEWVTPLKRQAAELYIDYLLEEETQRKAMEIGLRPVSQTISVGNPFTVEYGVQTDISKVKAFRVPDERVLRRVRELWEEAKMPASIVLLLDISGSMQGEPLENAKKGAMTFIDKMNKWDELEVITFNHQLTNLVPLDRISVNGEKGKQKIQTLFADGGTRLFDGMQKGLNSIKKRRQKAPMRRYGLVVLSDGDDTNSELGRYDFSDSLPKGDNPNVIKIFTIAYGGKANRDLLIEISNTTNARMFKSSPDAIEKVYRELSTNF
jgi:Ca-activated chloride channel family protein